MGLKISSLVRTKKPPALRRSCSHKHWYLSPLWSLQTTDHSLVPKLNTHLKKKAHSATFLALDFALPFAVFFFEGALRNALAAAWKQMEEELDFWKGWHVKLFTLDQVHRVQQGNHSK